MLMKVTWKPLVIALLAVVAVPACTFAAPALQSFSFANTTFSFSIVGNRPAGTVQGDLLIAVMVTDGDGENLTGLGGWAAITGNIGSNHTSRSWYRIAGASEPATYTFTVGSSEQITLGILRISGHDPASPIDVSGTNTGTSTSPTAPSATTTVNSAMVLRYYGADDDDYTGDDTGYPPGHTGIYRRQSGGLWGECHQGVAYLIQTVAGPTGTASFSQNNDEQWSAVTIGITPAPALPDIAMIKSVDTYSDPVSGLVKPKALPGGELDYTVTATNSGSGATDTNTVVVTDSIPANMELYVADLTGPLSGPIDFTDGPTASGLTCTFIALDSDADDVTFFDATGEFFPSPDADGYDSAVVSIEINPKGQFDAAAGGNNPSF